MLAQSARYCWIRVTDCVYSVVVTVSDAESFAMPDSAMSSDVQGEVRFRKLPFA